MSPKIASALLLIALVALITPRQEANAQATPESGTPTPTPGIPPVVWRLDSITGADGAEQTPDDPAKYTLQFLPDGVAAIVADCNQGTGAYTLDGNDLAISNIITTLVGCPPGSISDEYVRALDDAVAFSFEEEALVLVLPTDGGVLRFTPSLEGVVWQWQEFQSGDGSTIAPDDPSRYTVQFLADGTVEVQADCNQGRGRYTLDGAQLDISAVALTRIGCPPGSIGNEFASALDEVVTYVFREGKLYLALPVDAGIHEFAARVMGSEPATPEASPIAG